MLLLLKQFLNTTTTRLLLRTIGESSKINSAGMICVNIQPPSSSFCSLSWTFVHAGATRTQKYQSPQLGTQSYQRFPLLSMGHDGTPLCVTYLYIEREMAKLQQMSQATKMILLLWSTAKSHQTSLANSVFLLLRSTAKFHLMSSAILMIFLLRSMAKSHQRSLAIVMILLLRSMVKFHKMSLVNSMFLLQACGLWPSLTSCPWLTQCFCCCCLRPNFTRYPSLS